MAKNGNIHPTRIFQTPEELEKAWEEYKESLEQESTKWGKVQYVGKDGNRVEDYPKLPLTFEGFSVFCYRHYGTVNHYFTNKEGYYNDFGSICSYIKEEIRTDQITGGLLGMYNPSITQRLNNLSEKTETTNKNIQVLNIDPFADE